MSNRSRPKAVNGYIILSPIDTHVEQTLRAGVISRTRVTPVHRLIHVAATQWIVVNIRNLLPHHLFGLDHLWVTAFLPHLTSLVDFVPQLIIRQFLKQGLRAIFLQAFGDRSSRKGLELTNSLS